MFKFFMGRGRKSIFTDVEQLVLGSVIDGLPEPYIEHAKEQIASYNVAQRFGKGKLVNLFQEKLLRTVSIPTNLRFPNLAEEYRLGEALVEGSDGFAVTGTVWVLGGRIFSIHFDQSPEKLKLPVKIASSRLFVDFSRKQIDSQLGVELPADYVQMVKSGVTCLNGWKIYDPSQQLKEIVWDDCNYYALAFKEETGFIGIPSGPGGQSLVFVDYDTYEVESIPISFTEFINSKG